MRRGSYSSRMLAAGVSQHATTPWPMPAPAELEARIFDLVWQHRSQPTRTGFPVLALDEAHAQEVGGRQVERMFGAGALGEVVFLAAMPRDWDAASIARQMQVEPFEECEQRRALWAERQAASA